MNKKILQLKSKISSKTNILNGSVAKQYKRCGKSNCRCRSDDKSKWHGPYWIWTRKVNGKTVSKTLNANQASAVKKAIQEMKEVNTLIEKWKGESLKEIENIKPIDS